MFGNFTAQIGIIAIPTNKFTSIQFWNFDESPSTKVLSNFSINDAPPDGIILINWNDGTPSARVLGGQNYSHIFN